jgi:cyclic pyranopterin phosphate synthase
MFELASTVRTPLVLNDSAPDEFKRGRPLVDRFGRRIDHLRLSVTSRCDLRCVYCRPDATRRLDCPAHELSDEQRAEFVGFLYREFGLTQVRITGGEPLLHTGVTSLIEAIRRSAPELNIAMTTNGRLLTDRCKELRSAGLDRLNVSVDSIAPERYRRITGGNLRDVLAGLEAAAAAGFPPPRINAVVLRGHNDDEVVDLVRWAFSRGSEIRFLEAMPIGPAAEANRGGFVPAAEVRRRIGEHFALKPLPVGRGETARRWLATNDKTRGIVATIAPVTEPFCSQCRRLRLTADGRLFPCLLDSRCENLEPTWTGGSFNPERAARIVLSAVRQKHFNGAGQAAAMVALGG